MEPGHLILILNFISTWFMVGLIWFVQVVHYPLFEHADRQRFPDFSNLHVHWTSRVVGPPMLIEALTSMMLVWVPMPVNPALVLLAAALLVIIWGSTAFLQSPLHSDLNRGFDERAHRQLVLTNWLRTVCWTLRGMLVCWFVTQMFNQHSTEFTAHPESHCQRPIADAADARCLAERDDT